VARLTPVEIFWKCWDVFIVGIGWFFASGLRRLSADLTVRYRVQMILGYPVSEFAKENATASRQRDRKPSERAHGRTLNLQRRLLGRDAARPAAQRLASAV
jgi:hypothetical protein